MNKFLTLTTLSLVLVTGSFARAGGFFCNFVDEGGALLIAGQAVADFTELPGSWAPGHFALNIDIQDKSVMALASPNKIGRGALLDTLLEQTSGADAFKRSYFISKSCSVTIDPAPVLAELLEDLERRDVLTMCSIDDGDPAPAAATADSLRHLKSGVVKLDCFYAHK